MPDSGESHSNHDPKREGGWGGAMNSNEQDPEETRPEVRYEVQVDPSRQVSEDIDLTDMDLDRVPDHEGVMRFIVSADQLEDLRRRNVVLEVGAELPVQALDAGLVYSDEEASSDLERRLEGIEREEGGS